MAIQLVAAIDYVQRAKIVTFLAHKKRLKRRTMKILIVAFFLASHALVLAEDLKSKKIEL